MIKPYASPHQVTPSPWTGQVSTQLSSTQSVLRACLGWVAELGIQPDMPFYQKKNLAMINAAAFSSLLLAMPGTFLLIILGFGHPFSLLIVGVLAACLTLVFNGARRVDCSQAMFAFAPATMIAGYALLEMSSQGLGQPLNYLITWQALCFSLLLPTLIYTVEGRQKVAIAVGICILILLVFNVGSMRLGAFNGANISGISHGLFSVLSLVQFSALSACVIYTQSCAMQHAQQTQKANDRLQKMAIQDGLTGTFNHVFMQQLIGDAINRSRRSSSPLALLMIDVDSFKQINDTFGHNMGDEVLVRLTRLLQRNKRSTDYLGRWGGDELVLLLTDTDLEGANNVGEKLRGLVESYVFPFGKRLTISLGASDYQSGDSPASFIARADAAMYRDKRGGRNRLEVDKLQIRVDI